MSIKKIQAKSPDLILKQYSANGGDMSAKIAHLNWLIDQINNLVSPKYKVYTALLTQTGTTAPVPTILENTLGTITWTYSSPGSYLANSTSFVPNKTTVLIGNYNNGLTRMFVSYDPNSNLIDLEKGDIDLDDGTFNASDVFKDIPIEIRVYN